MVKELKESKELKAKEGVYTLNTHTLYLVCGPQGVGKSTFIQDTLLPSFPSYDYRYADSVDGLIVNVDDYAEKLGLLPQTNTPEGFKKTTNSEVSVLLSDFAYKLVEHRVSQQLTTIVDMVLSTDSQREKFIGLARKYNMDVVVFILSDDPVEVLRRASRRDRYVPLKMVYASLEKQSLTSKVPYLHVKVSERSSSLSFIWEVHPKFSLPRDVSLDFISDVHGLYEPLQLLLAKLGYTLDSQGVPVHPKGNKLVFMGDVVDRGPDSVKVLDFVRLACQKGGHLMILGNHEANLLRYLKSALEGVIIDVKSRATMETGALMLQQPEWWQRTAVDFLSKLPGYLVDLRSQVLVQHSDCVAKFNLCKHMLSYCLAGKGLHDEGWDTDTEWSSLNPDWTLIRGHIMPTSAKPISGVKVVFNEGEYGGTLVSLRVPALVSLATQGMLEETWVHQETNFDYEAVRSSKPELSKKLGELVRENLVYKVHDTKEGFFLHRYQARVHYDRHWLRDLNVNGDPACESVMGNPLSEARGIVLDWMGNIVIRPFYKVLNVGEYGLALAKDEKGTTVVNFENRWDDTAEVEVVEKINGYALFMRKHPSKMELFASCTGSLGKEAPFVKMALAWLYQQKSYGKYLEMCAKYPDYTFAFEVVLKDDPHVCHYDESQQGLYLTGARHTATGETVSESWLDERACELGDVVHRPEHYYATVGDVKKLLRTQFNKEGVMLRHVQTGQLLAKWKFTWYLTKKFFSNLPKNRILHMFKNPKDFKKTIEEEYFEVVDALTSTYTVETFQSMSQEERVAEVSKLFNLSTS